MAGKHEPHDARMNAARYQVDKAAGRRDETEPQGEGAEQPTAQQAAQYAEIAIQQAIRRGDFDNLPGAGKPLRNLDQVRDPNWWIRQKIDSEQLTGLGPPALTLRTEDAQLDDRLDRAGSEGTVREILEDFNQRVVEARRQLLGGPPVVTPTRDIDAEVARWRERRAARQRERDRQREQEAAALAAMPWWERRRTGRRR